MSPDKQRTLKLVESIESVIARNKEYIRDGLSHEDAVHMVMAYEGMLEVLLLNLKIIASMNSEVSYTGKVEQ